MRRAILLILDSVGVGALPDAHLYGDEGSNTLGNTAKAAGGLDLPNLARLGLGNIIPIEGVPPENRPDGAWGKMIELSPGKDTTTGHWELAGLVLERPFPTYPQGFPAEIIAEFEERIGRKVLGNYAASGTVIIEDLGREHLKTGFPIVYTSADSVFQIAVHEEIAPAALLYQWCVQAREMLQGQHGVGRVIARPFVGQPGQFVRTPNRKDFSLPPPRPTVLDALQNKGIAVYGVGKIFDIFAGQGITRSYGAKNNVQVLAGLFQALGENPGPGLIFANLVDFDMLYGHRNDPLGYGRELERFDSRLPEILAALREEDLLIISADHGCDPTTPSTDHSREYVPLLVAGSQVKPAALGIRNSFADVAATLAAYFQVDYDTVGVSFLEQILAEEAG